MFIYMITANDKKYIGFDSHPAYKKKRWKAHCRRVENNDTQYKVHEEMIKAGIENCTYEILEDGFDNIVSLAVAEMYYIKKFDTKNNGLNSTYGGDGMSTHLHCMSEEEIAKIKESLSTKMKEINEDKWKDTTSANRKDMTSHLRTDEVVKKRTNTLIEFYKSNPEVKKEKAKAITKWQKENREQLKKQNRKNSLLGAAKLSKKIKVILPTGVEKIYESKSAFAREHGYIINNVIKMTKQGLTQRIPRMGN